MPAPSGARKAFSVSASQGPAVTCAQSGAAASAPSSATAVPASSRIASAKARPRSAASSPAARKWRIVRSSRARSTSTQRPRSNTSPSVPASRSRTSLSVSGSPSSVVSTAKSSSASRPSPDGARVPMCAATCGRSGRPEGQVAGMRTTTPAAFEVGHAAEQALRLRHRPAQRMEDFARFHHGAQPVAAFGGPLHRQQQRQQLRAVGRACVFAQCLTERRVPGSAVVREPGRVGRHEGERRLGIAAVLGEVEVHAPDQVPGRVQPLENRLQGGPGLRNGGGHGPASFRPERAQGVRGQVFGAGHEWRRQHQRCELALRWRRDIRNACDGVRGGRVVAERCHVAGREAAPPREGRRQRLPDLCRAEPQQPRATALRERGHEARGDGGIHLLRASGGFADEVTVRREAEPQTRGGRGAQGGGCSGRPPPGCVTHHRSGGCSAERGPRATNPANRHAGRVRSATVPGKCRGSTLSPSRGEPGQHQPMCRRAGEGTVGRGAPRGANRCRSCSGSLTTRQLNPAKEQRPLHHVRGQDLWSA